MSHALARPPVAFLTRLARDVRSGLMRTPKRLEPLYLYDHLGSALFDAICELPWYRITRAERRLIEQRAAEIVARLVDPVAIVELGPGNGAKLAQLVEALGPRLPEPQVHLIDVSRAALARARRAVRRAGSHRVTTYRGTFHGGLRRLPADVASGGSSWRSSSARTSATSSRRRPWRCCGTSARRCRPAAGGSCSGPTS